MKVTLPSKSTTQKKPWYKKVLTGEMSKLRQVFSGLTTGRWGQSYQLDTSKVDYELTRGLYHNSLEKYKLGAAFAKPIVDTTTGFVGTPRWLSDDEDAQEVLDEHRNRWVATLQKVNRNTFRDGDCYTRIFRKPIEERVLFKSEKPRIDLEIYPPQAVSSILDPETGKVMGFMVTINVTYLDDTENQKAYDIVEEITATEIITYYKGNDVPAELKQWTKENPKTEKNKWGFVPIIHWTNDSEEDELNGRSDLEPVEPFMKAYHDVMMNSLKNNKLHSAPKMKLKVNDVASFLKLNFGVDIENLKPGEKPRINFDGSEIIIQPHGDDEIELLQAQSTMTDSAQLLEFLFYCIVDVSQTPEFAFGTAMQSSKASVKEQMTPLLKKVERKREMMEENYKLLARMLLAMYEKASSGELEITAVTTYDTKLDWNDISPRDVAEESLAFKNYLEALVKAVESGMMSLETSVNFLADFIPQLEDYKEEQKRILEGSEFLDRIGKGNQALSAEEDEAKKLLEGKMGNGDIQDPDEE